MKKLSEISESIWRNISQRSEGIATRKEDRIVNNLSYKDFYEYLNNTYINLGYKCKYDTSYKIECINDVRYDSFKINIPIEINNEGWTTGLCVEYDSNTGECVEISINDDITYYHNNIENVLEKKFKIKYNEYRSWNTIKKVGKKPVTNSDIIYLIDKLLNMVKQPLFKKKTKIDESIWRNISQRSEGIVTRKENNIELFDRDGMYDLIVDTFEFKKDAPYSKIVKAQTSEENKYISIPIMIMNYHLYKMSINFENDKINRIKIFLSYDELKECCPSLFEKFIIVKNDSGGGLQIYPKNNQKITNKFCMDVLETILTENEYSILQKREN